MISDGIEKKIEELATIKKLLEEKLRSLDPHKFYIIETEEMEGGEFETLTSAFKDLLKDINLKLQFLICNGNRIKTVYCCKEE